MIWRSTGLLLAAFVVAAASVWFSPVLLDLLGLSEFVFVGQVCFAILALSLLEAGYRRLPGGSHDPG
jgi:hypothetical protein